MKKIFILILILSVSACIPYYETDIRKTEAGKIAFDAVNDLMAFSSTQMELFQKIDLYLQATSIEERNRIALKVLKGEYSFYPDDKGNVLVKEHYGHDYIIQRKDSTPLSEKGAWWWVTYGSKDYTINNITIECTEDNLHDFEILGDMPSGGYYGVEIQAGFIFNKKTDNNYTPFLICNNYDITTQKRANRIASNRDSGDGFISVQFDIVNTIRLQPNSNNVEFSEGSILMHAHAQSDDAITAQDEIIAEIISPNSVAITFRGITEVW